MTIKTLQEIPGRDREIQRLLQWILSALHLSLQITQYKRLIKCLPTQGLSKVQCPASSFPTIVRLQTDGGSRSLRSG